MDVLPTGMFVYHMHAWCSCKSEEGFRSPGSKVIDGCEPPCGCWKSNLRSSARQTNAFVNVKPSCQTLALLLACLFVCETGSCYVA